jgi:hypothetical protein
VTLPIQESHTHVQKLITRLREQEHSGQLTRFLVYAPVPKRARCYLQTLHTAIDNCDHMHSSEELGKHIGEGSKIRVFRSLSKMS